MTSHERVLGVDGCKGGWVGVVLETDAEATAIAAPSIRSLTALAGRVLAIGIDIPIHLNADADRACDSAARRFIRPCTSRVFNAPVRQVLDCETYVDACATSFAAIGKKISKQTWALVPKIAEVEEWRTSAPCPVYEVHPEAAFATMAGQAVAERKRSPQGERARRALLESVGIIPPRKPSGVRLGVDDLLDACAAAWSSLRLARGEGRSLGRVDRDDGTTQAIWY